MPHVFLNTMISRKTSMRRTLSQVLAHTITHILILIKKASAVDPQNQASLATPLVSQK
jgi:hypothetical protein